jgi:hypothetical protein
VSDRPVQILLDASAITAFTRRSVDVGEILAEVDDEHAAAGLPVLCLVEASRAVVDGDLLDYLVAHRATAVLPVEPDGWRALAATYDTVGRLGAASAVLAAAAADLPILTAQPALYAGLEGGGPIIRIRRPDHRVPDLYGPPAANARQRMATSAGFPLARALWSPSL